MHLAPTTPPQRKTKPTSFEASKTGNSKNFNETRISCSRVYSGLLVCFYLFMFCLFFRLFVLEFLQLLFFFSSWLCWPGFHQFRFTRIIQNTEIIHKLHDARAEEEGKKKKKKKKTSDDKNDDHGSDYEDGDDRKYGENADGTDDILIYGPSRMFQHNMSHNQNRTILWLSVNDSHPHCDDRSPFGFLLILEPELYFTSRLCTSASSVVATENAARRRM